MLGFLITLALMSFGGFFLLLIFSLFRASSRADETEDRLLEIISPDRSPGTKRKTQTEVLQQDSLASTHAGPLDR